MKKTLTLFLAFVLLLSALLTGCGVKEPDQPKETDTTGETEMQTDSQETALETQNTPSDEPMADKQSKATDFLRLYGRVPIAGDTFKLYWTNSGFSFRFMGTGAEVLLNTSSTNPTYLAYLQVFLDGSPIPSSTLTITQNGTYTLASGLESGLHTVEVRKRNEAMYGESATLTIRKIEVQGQFCVEPPQAQERIIEFVGDSITSGFGNMIADGSGDFTTRTQDGTLTYATLAAKRLGANANVLSRSGICYVTGSNRATMFNAYTGVANLPNQSVDPKKWDFESNPVDVVVINLGTNDQGAQIDNRAIPGDTYTQMACDMIRLVRANNPHAVIVWAYGLMGQGLSAYLKAAVKQCNDEGDSEVFFFQFPVQNTVKNGVGTHSHPSYMSQLEAGVLLSDYLADLMGWETDETAVLGAQIRIARNVWIPEADKKYESGTVNNLKNAVRDAELSLSDSDPTVVSDSLKAIRKAYESLAKPEDVSDEYIVLETFDKQQNWKIGGSKTGVDTENMVAGAGCFTTSGMPNIYFIRDGNSANIAQVPDDFSEWYFELWIYLDREYSFPAGCCIEISQTVDQIELAYEFSSLGLVEGWNHLMLPVSSAGKTRFDELETIRNIRIFLVKMPSELTLKADDLVLTRGKIAKDRKDLDDLIKEAEKAGTGVVSGEILERAKSAVSQREVDNAIETLNALLG